MFRKILIQILFNTTARVFGGQSKCIIFMSAGSALKTYAKATCTWMEQPDAGDTGERMYDEMYRLGRLVRRLLLIRSQSRAHKWIKYLYSCIGIDVSFEEGEGGCVMNVSSCFFSNYYSKEMCEYISMMDKGLVCGVSGRSDFYFVDRLTDGCSRCTAHLR